MGEIKRCVPLNLDPLASGEARPIIQPCSRTCTKDLDPLASGEARRNALYDYKEIIGFRSTSLRRG